MYGSGIQYTSVSSVSASSSTVLGADNGLSKSTVTPSNVVLGQDVNQTGNPATLSSQREVPMAQKQIFFTDKTVHPLNKVTIGGNTITVTGRFGVGPAPAITVQETSLSKAFTRTLENGGFMDSTSGVANPIEMFYHDSGPVQLISVTPQFQVIDLLTSEFTAVTGGGMGMVTNFGTTGNSPGIQMNDQVLNDILLINMDFVNHVSVINATPNLAINNNTFFGGITTTATARIHIVAGTNVAHSGPLKFTAGISVTTPEAGLVEYDGTNLFFTPGATRESVLLGNSGAAAPGTTVGVAIANFYGTSATNYLGQPNSWIAVVIGGSTFKIPLYT